MIAGGLVAYVTCLDPKKVPVELAGRRFDRDFLDLLGPEVDPCAERGEFHTCVTAGPMFAQPVAVELGETVQRDGFVFADLKLAPIKQ
jgi:diphthamide synthase (EF-2-diphthine--ammonia ligase)